MVLGLEGAIAPPPVLLFSGNNRHVIDVIDIRGVWLIKSGAFFNVCKVLFIVLLINNKLPRKIF